MKNSYSQYDSVQLQFSIDRYIDITGRIQAVRWVWTNPLLPPITV